MLRELRHDIPKTLTLEYWQRNKIAVVGMASLVYVVVIAAVSWEQFLQFTSNSFVVGAVYSMIAMGFTLVFGTVWFFDLTYSVMPAIGAYAIFNYHLREPIEPSVPLATILGLIVAGICLWLFYETVYQSLRRRFSGKVLLSLAVVLAGAIGSYFSFILVKPGDLHIYTSPAIGMLTAATIGLILYKLIVGRLIRSAGSSSIVVAALISLAIAAGTGIFCGVLLSRTANAILPLSAVLGVFYAGCISLALYRGFYYYLRRRARSPMIMIVASLGIMLAMQAAISVIFTPQPQRLPDPFGIEPVEFLGAFIKPFQIFNIGLAIAILLGLLFLLRRTIFGKAIRAISSDEEVAKIVGINTPFIIAGAFFLGAAIGAVAGISLGLDLNNIQPRMGFLPLFKGWIAAVIGGTGNLYGAMLGGFLLGMVENYGVWFIASEWKDAIAFIVFIFFLLFKPRGLLPRK